MEIMKVLATHITFRLADGRSICRTSAQRRRVARAFLERAQHFSRLAFRIVADHLHALVAVGPREAAEYARRVEVSIQKSRNPGVRCAPAHVTPVRSQRHIRNAFDDILRQEQHHEVGSDPLHDGSNLPDLLGARVVGTYTANNVREFLPRVRRKELLRCLPDPDVLDNGRALGLLDLPFLADGAAAAFGLPHIRGSRPEALIARIAAVGIGLQIGPASLVGRALGISATSVRRLARCELSDIVVEAVEAQTRLRAAAKIGAANL